MDDERDINFTRDVDGRVYWISGARALFIREVRRAAAELIALKRVRSHCRAWWVRGATRR